jgi:hypothetical protein
MCRIRSAPLLGRCRLFAIWQKVAHQGNPLGHGGANHNDRDNCGIGIAGEIEKEFPVRYCAVDLYKPSLFLGDKNPSRTTQNYLETLRPAGFSAENLDKVVVVPLENDFRANYIVFLPERRFMVEDAGK